MEYDESEFIWQKDFIALPLSNGLIGLGDDWWVIKHTSHEHLSARVAPAEDFISFTDQTLWNTESDTWVFELYHGDRADALALANRINIGPVVYH